MPLAFLEDRALRLLLFGGKGGAGKTTCAAAAALWLAARDPGRRFLLVSTDPAHSLADCLADIRPPDNLTVEELDAGAVLEEFRRRHQAHLHEIASRGTFLTDGQIGALLQLSLPGLDELMAFLDIAERSAGGEWDCVLVDTAPTGHTVRLLEMPELIGAWLAALDALLAKHQYMRQVFGHSDAPDHLDRFLRGLSQRVAAGKALLCDPGRCRFVPVMLAEHLSVRETGDLLETLGRLGVGVEEIVVNQLYPERCCASCAATRTTQQQVLGGVFLDSRWARYALYGVPVYPGAPALESFWDGARRISRGGAAAAAARMAQWRVSEPAPAPAPELKLLIVGGKGGVGKTTIACATALAAAREDSDRRILLFSADPAHSLGDCLEIEAGARPVMVRGGLDAVEIDAAAELREWKRQYGAGLERFFGAFSQRFDLVFDRQAMERLLDLAPAGLDEVMALCRMTELLAAGRYDTVIVDSAATGHLLRLLELPGLVQDWLRALFDVLLDHESVLRIPEFTRQLVEFSKHLKQLRKLLADRRLAQVYAVAIPTRMALEETADLLAACTRMGIAVPVLFVNLVTGTGECALCESQRRQEAAVLARLRELARGKRLMVIERGAEPRGVAALESPGLFAEVAWAAR